MFWDRFYSLCMENNTTPNAVRLELGLSSSATTKWKRGSVPEGDTITRIAGRFGVTVGYLLGHTDARTNDKAPTGEPAGAGLTELDMRLLEIFRGLSAEDQGRMLERAEMLAEQNREQGLSFDSG